MVSILIRLQGVKRATLFLVAFEPFKHDWIIFLHLTGPSRNMMYGNTLERSRTGGVSQENLLEHGIRGLSTRTSGEYYSPGEVYRLLTAKF